MKAKTKCGLAILTVVFLLFTSIWTCASMSAASPVAHPCCPKPPVQDCQTPGCVCVNKPLTTVAESANRVPVLALPANTVPEPSPVAAIEQPTFVPVLFAPHRRYLSFHQLLL